MKSHHRIYAALCAMFNAYHPKLAGRILAIWFCSFRLSAANIKENPTHKLKWVTEPSAMQKKRANNHVAMPQQNRVRHKREGSLCTLNGISMKFLCEIFALCSSSISSSSNIKKDDGLPTFSQLFLCLFLFLLVYFLYMIFFSLVSSICLSNLARRNSFICLGWW